MTKQLKIQLEINPNNKYTLYEDDAFLLVDKFIENNLKVDHIITDPPYNISKQNNLNTLKNRVGVNFGLWDNNFNLFDWIDKYLKILNKNGSFICFCSYLYLSDIIKVLEQNQMQIKDIIIWKKTNPMPRNINRRYVQDMEFAIWAVRKGARWIFNKDIDKPYLRSMFEFPVVHGKEKTIHPTQKSLKLMEEIIKIHTNENDLILDPFMGSATTGVAAIKLHRKFIGIEKNNKYFNIAKQRILNITKNEEN